LIMNKQGLPDTIVQMNNLKKMVIQFNNELIRSRLKFLRESQ